MTAPLDIKPEDGKLGVLLPGMGAVSTTFIAGVLAGRKGLTQLHGSLTLNTHLPSSGRLRYRPRDCRYASESPIRVSRRETSVSVLEISRSPLAGENQNFQRWR